MIWFLRIIVFVLILNSIDSNEEHEDIKKNNKTGPPPYVGSYVYVQHLAKIEQQLYKIMENYEKLLKQRLRIVSNYVKDYEESTMKGTIGIEDEVQRTSTVASHPLMAYRLIRRFASEIDALGKDLSSDVETQIRNSVGELGGGHPWPTRDDHESAMDALLRLQYVYNLDLKDVTSGKLGDIQTNVGLTAKQCFHIAKFASYANFHSLAIEWLGITSWKVLNTTEEGHNEVGPNTIALAYRHSVEKHNAEIEKTKNSENLYTFVDKISNKDLPLTKRAYSLGELAEDPLDLDEIQELPDGEQAERAHYDYVSLCNGISSQAERDRSDLHCYYEQKKNPYWLINPLKIEILNVDPPLIQIYEFINDNWINYLIKKASPISYAPPTPSAGATPRTASYAWLNDSEIPKTPLSRRIELITGLNVRGEEASTALQIASYIFGGHVANHVDSLGENVDERGDRVTTFLIYLNDVISGGYTAFPILGTFVKPIKGSAILWYDSLRNGEIDDRMLHGACPPIFGHKWIATKWTHVNENMFTRPCALDPYA